MDALVIVGLVVFGIVIVVLYPFAAIWSVNTLFGLTIEYSFSTWVAALLLTSPATINRK